LDDIKRIEGINLITDTIIKTRIDTLYWVISKYDSMPSRLNPEIDTFFLVSWTAYDRRGWDTLSSEIRNYWKYGDRQGFGVLETKKDTIIDQYIKSVICKNWEID
jgi:hypothetical protein